MLLSARLEKFQQKDQLLYNFRCPICGDSDRNEFKARGYMFENKGKLFYKCHNCGSSKPFDKFLKDEDPMLYQEYIFEKFGEKNKKKKEYTFEKPKFDKKAELEDYPDFFVPIKRLPDDHFAVRFLKNRKISLDNELYFIDNSKKLESLDDSYAGRLIEDAGRIVIPYRNRSNKIVGYTARALDGSSLRYINVKISDEPMIWGLNRIKLDKKILVTEGAFDAMFLKNAVAASGSDLKKLTNYFDSSKLIFIFDNEPRNRQNVKKMDNLINQGFSVFVPPKSLIGKDINEMVLRGTGQEQIQDIINTSSLSGILAKIKFTQWKKV